MEHLRTDCPPSCLVDIKKGNQPCLNCHNNPSAPRVTLAMGEYEMILDYKRTVLVGPKGVTIRNER